MHCNDKSAAQALAGRPTVSPGQEARQGVRPQASGKQEKEEMDVNKSASQKPAERDAFGLGRMANTPNDTDKIRTGTWGVFRLKCIT